MAERTQTPGPAQAPTDTHAAAAAAAEADPGRFWLDAARAVTWIDPPRSAHADTGNGLVDWFPGATLNTAHNALDRHVGAGLGEQAALLYVSATTGREHAYSYRELLDQVRRAAGALRDLGVGRGDRVLIYLPMIPEAVVSMLACARLGAVHAVVFGGFGAAELAARIDDAQPSVVVTATGGLEPGRTVPYLPLLDAALAEADWRPRHVVVVDRPEVCEPAGRTVGWPEHRWAELLADAEPADCVPVPATDPLYILYTSGTTGAPKGIVRDNGGHAVAMSWCMPHVYGIGAGDVVFAASDIGWVVGHSFIVYGPLLAGATAVLFEGKPVGTPDAGAFWDVVERHRVSVLLTAPTAMRAIRREDPRAELLAGYDLSSLRGIFLAGERLDPDTQQWLCDVQPAPVVNNWWQTETGWPVISNFLGLTYFPPRPGSSTKPVPGFTVAILGHDGKPVAPGQEGDVCLRLPLPPGTLTSVWGDEDRLARSYLTEHPGYYCSGDGGHVDDDGYVYILGRTDDVMNVAGHRMSSGQIETAIAEHPGVSECAVVGARDELKGQRPYAIVVPEVAYAERVAELATEVGDLVRRRVGPIAALGGVSVVPALPKTRSGKIVRRCLRQILDGDDPDVPPTIENPAVVTDLTIRLAADSPTRSPS
ncbi:propionyl-CoA synthetase [Gordonia desulfuricans]|uniref:Propionyl-CoA synthetase n=1 Tax=Gordonia desulfuricans TaxID=89051 RepID=A0A7K3LMQ3_9ACTN|nr:AMP-binding protein [Gordonia desulfuricans]NDK89536.1 propionyl-CoA synthetase [Gordonia desulfuricans]